MSWDIATEERADRVPLLRAIGTSAAAPYGVAGLRACEEFRRRQELSLVWIRESVIQVLVLTSLLGRPSRPRLLCGLAFFATYALLYFLMVIVTAVAEGT
jgi:hypothetical protein